MTVRLMKRYIATVLPTALVLLFSITAIANSENSGLAGTTLRGVLSNGDLVLGEHRHNDLTGSSGSGLRGSSGSGLRGSSGSGLRGSSGSGLRGSSGSGLRGSSGSGLRGSSGSGLRGSSGSGLRGSSGSGLRESSDQNGFRNSHRYVSSFDELPLLAVGPVSEISADGNILEVLGQSIIVDDTTTFIIFDLNGALVSIDAGVRNLNYFEQDDYIAVAGDPMDPGLHLGTILIKLPRHFVDGASPVYVRTMLDSVDLSVGQASSGSTLIDFTATLYNTRNLSTQSGNVVEYFGYTSANHKTLVATSGYIVDVITENDAGQRRPAGSNGSGLRGSSGSGLRGSSGSGLRGSSGSGLRGSSGSGLRGSSGSGLRGSSGSGLRGSSGSGLRGSSGSGLK